MDIQRVWMLLQVYKDLIGLPQYAAIRAEVEKQLAEINSPPQSKAEPVVRRVVPNVNKEPTNG